MLESNEAVEINDRLMKVVSNMVSNPIRYHPDIHFENAIRDKAYDFFQIDDHLKGESACHLMNPDQIYKSILMKNESQSSNK